MTGADHEHSASVEQAAQWLSEQQEGSVRPLIPTLRERFGLTSVEACEASAMANRFRTYRKAHG